MQLTTPDTCVAASGGYALQSINHIITYLMTTLKRVSVTIIQCLRAHQATGLALLHIMPPGPGLCLSEELSRWGGDSVLITLRKLGILARLRPTAYIGNRN